MTKIEFRVEDREILKKWTEFAEVIIWCQTPADLSANLKWLKKYFQSTLDDALNAAVKQDRFKALHGHKLTFSSNKTQVALSFLPKNRSVFAFLEWGGRQARCKALTEPGNTLVIFPSEPRENVQRAIDGLTSAITVKNYRLPSFKSKPAKSERKPGVLKICYCVEGSSKAETTSLLLKSQALAEGTNLVRELAVTPGNHLAPGQYKKKAEDLAKRNGLNSTWISLSQLQKRGAGAFVAVAKGATDPASGILKIVYTHPREKSHLALVGKGVCFDTGGFNIKTGGHMYGMHEDMTGAAIALSLIIALKQIKFPMSVTAYLAITENVLSPGAYRPNDVVTALNGRTIEIVDTDAEGRLILADALTLAGQEGASAMIDFATLTGACVRALGTVYSGAYANQRRLFPVIRGAGRRSGERVWPFPNDADYGRCLKSEVADIKQCRPSGGVDHIEAGYFLSRFVPGKVPWVHVDLSASSNEGGLGHVRSKTTGFGVRFGVELANRLAHRIIKG